MQTFKAWLGGIFWLLAVCLMALTAGDWDTGMLEVALAIIACVATFAALAGWLGVSRSPVRHHMGWLRKVLTVVGALLGLIVAAGPAVALLAFGSTLASRGAARQILIPIALAGLLITFLSLVVPVSKPMDEIGREYRAKWQLLR